MTALWSVTACHRPYLDLLRVMLADLWGGIPAERRIVVANGPDPIRPEELPDATVIRGPDVRSNAAWWQAGMDHVAAHGGGHILFIDADARTDGATVTRMAEAIDRYGLAYVGVDRRGVLTEGGLWIRGGASPYHDLRWRPSGYCFVLADGAAVRPDPQFSHWYLDDDMELQAMLCGGVGMVSGWVDHPDDRHWDEDTQAKRDADRALFVAKWGRPAWV